MSDILNDSAWVQVSLTVRVGGIGIGPATQLASSAYLASATGCLEMIQKALLTHFRMHPTISAADALQVSMEPGTE